MHVSIDDKLINSGHLLASRSDARLGPLYLHQSYTDLCTSASNLHPSPAEALRSTSPVDVTSYA